MTSDRKQPRPARRARPAGRRRVLLRLLAGLVLLTAVVPISAWLALRSESVRSSLLRAASTELEGRTGIRARAGDFAFRPLAGELVVERLELRDGNQGDPFVRVARLEARLRWRSLIGDGPIVFHDLRSEELWVDLPGIPAVEPSAPPSADPPAFEVEHFQIVNATVVGLADSVEADPLLDRWQVTDLALSGSLLAERVEVALESGRLQLLSHRRAPIVAELAGRLTGEIGENFELEAFSAVGCGLNFQATGAGLPDPLRIDRLGFTLSAEPALLFPDLTTGGHLDADGEMQIAESVVTGTFRLDTRQFPAELLRPWVDGSRLEALGLARSWFDAQGDFRVAMPIDGIADGAGDLEGAIELSWSRPEEELLQATLRSLETPDGVRLAVDADLLVADPGMRRLHGELLAPAWPALAEARLRDVALSVDVPDLPGLFRRLGIDERDGNWRPFGGLHGRLRAEGRLSGPTVMLQATWTDAERRLLILEADSRPLPGTGEPLRLSFGAALLPDDEGAREVGGVLLAPDWNQLTRAELRDGRIKLSLPDVARSLQQASDLWSRVSGDASPAWPIDRWPGALTGSARLSGPLLTPAVELEADWRPGRGERVALSVDGSTLAAWPFLDGSAVMAIQGLDASRLARLAGVETSDGHPSGKIDAELQFQGNGDELDLSIRAGGGTLVVDERWTLDRWLLEAGYDGTELDIRSLSGQLADNPFARGPSRFEAGAKVILERPLRRAELRIEIDDPLAGLEGATLQAGLEDGSVAIESLQVAWSEGSTRVSGQIPLGALAGLFPALTELPVERSDGPISLDLTGLRLATLFAALGIEGEPTRVAARLDGAVALDPSALLEAEGNLEISDLAIQLEEEPLAADGSLRLAFGEGRLVLQPSRLEMAGGPLRGNAPLDLAGYVELNRGWKAGDPPESLISDLRFEAHGSLDAALLTPMVSGARASGLLQIDATAGGPLDALTADVSLRGPGATVLWTTPYITRLEDPTIDLTVREGRVVLRELRAGLNGGELRAAGLWTPERGLRVEATFDDVPYRMVYDLSTLLDGRLVLDWPVSGRPELSGELTVVRGSLRRDNLNYEIEALRLLLGRPSGRSQRVPDLIGVDLTVSTAEGIRVKNNTADLRVDWDPIHVDGTLANPLLSGRLDIEPGGMVQAAGQVIRIDEGRLVWDGDPVEDPGMIFEVVSSLEDPTLLQSWRGTDRGGLVVLGPGAGGWMDFRDVRTESGGGGETPTSVEEALTAAARSPLLNAANIGLSKTELGYQPLPLFGETDTQARFTVSQQISPFVTFIGSANPREAEGQTYILDLHQLRFSRTLRGQIFTRDNDRWGLTLQQTHHFGGSPIESDSPRLRSIAIQGTSRIKTRKLRRAAGYRKHDPFPPGATLDVEVDVTNALLRRGFPAAEVEVEAAVDDDDRVEVLVEIATGPKVRFRFAGTRLSRGEKRRIAAAYSTAAVDEEAALADVAQEARSALRARGFLWPEVGLTTVPPDGNQPQTVLVTLLGGRRALLRSPFFEGLPAEEARFLASRFEQLETRVELAIAEPATDAYLLHLLESRGYPTATIVSRTLSDDGERLSVEIAAGPRQQIGSIEIVGVEQEQRRRLTATLELSAGDPARRDGIRNEATRLERLLRDQGHADARVRARVETSGLESTVRFQIDPGPVYRVEEVLFVNPGAARKKWVKRVAGFEPHGLLRTDDLADARRRLSGTGVFSRVRVRDNRGERAAAETTTVRASEPGADGTIGTSVTFDLRERQRFSLSYGARWEDTEGLGLVVDFVDHNSLGRGHTSGIRGIWSRVSSIRLYHVIPRVLGPKNSLELFIEGKQGPVDATDNVEAKGLEAWGQLTIPLSRRLQTRGYVRLARSDFEIPNAGIEVPLEQRNISPVFGWQLAYGTIDRGAMSDQRKGLFFGVDLSGSNVVLGADLTHTALYGQFKYFLPFARRYRWAQSWRAGIIDAAGEPIPLLDRQRAGGEYSVRGYPVNSLGPQGPEGLALGGEVLFVVNQEIHRHFMDTLSGLVFVDAGNVWIDRNTLDGDLFYSTGLGIRYRSPIGPLRLDVARPLNRRESDPEYKVYLGFGVVF